MGDHKYHSNTLKKLREALKHRSSLVCAIMLDTKGPEIRTGFLENGKSVQLVKDQILEISTILFI
jgi:pyruvate kinase